MLKPKLILPPLLALAVGGVWLGTQRQSISALERESEVLQKAIAARSSGTAVDAPGSKPASPAKAGKDKEKPDWKKIAAQMAEMNQSGGMGDMRSMIRLQQRVQAMSREDLAAALDEIATLDLSAEARSRLEQLLIGPLIQKDPEFALTKFIDHLQDNDGMLGWSLASAMQEWAKKDPARASAWFDQQIAAGKFDSKSLDGKSQSRNQFEGSLIHILLSSDPDAAGRRLGAMPEDQRDDVLSRAPFQQIKDEDQIAFAKLVRTQISEKDQARTLAQQAARFVGDDGYPKVTEFLDRIQATPAERTACAEKAAESRLQRLSHQKPITREDLDAMREWVGTQSPESTDSVTGKALASASQNGQKTPFAEAAKLAVQYHDASGNDDVLASFLDGWPARRNKEQSRLLAEKIADPERRAKVLKNLK